MNNIPGTFDGYSQSYKVSVYDIYNDRPTTVKHVGPESGLGFAQEPHDKRLVVLSSYKNTWLLQYIKESYGIHGLTIEDIVNTHQRSKYESYDSYDCCIINKGDVLNGQVSIIVTTNTVLVFMEQEEKCIWNLIKSRVVGINGRIREKDTGYMAYVIMDVIMDQNFEYLKSIEEEINVLDDKIEADSKTPKLEYKSLAMDIHSVKHKILSFKKTTWPMREMVNNIIRNDLSLLVRDEKNVLYLRDLQDHMMRLTENIDGLRDTAYSLVEMYMNVMSMRMNEVMKVLTVITTIFVPITFLTSVYGMNFEDIPEIHFKHGYAWFWSLVLVMAAVMYRYFRKKNWL